MNPVRCGPFRIWFRIAGEHIHPESAEDLRRDPTDLPCADDPGGLPVEIEPDEAIERKIVIPDAGVGQVDLAIQGQQESDGVFGDRIGRIRRDPTDSDICLLYTSPSPRD